MSNIVYARKQGRVFTVFMDQGRPMPIVDFETEPSGFPQTIIGEESLRAAFPGYEFKFIEEPRKEQPLAVRPTEAAVAAFLKDNRSATPTAPVSLPSPTKNGDVEKAIQYFKILLAQETVAAQNKKERLRMQVATCANLILAVWPDAMARLEQAREEMRGFTLG